MAAAYCCRCKRNPPPSLQDVELGEQEEKVCRLCYEAGERESLIAPCKCSGSSKWVHRRCLDNWRATKHNEQCFTHCTTCNYQYRIFHRENRRSKRLKLFLLITRDVLTFLLIAELIIIILSGISYGLDRAAGWNIWRLFPFQTWPSEAQVGVFYLTGIVIFFASLGVIGLIVGSLCLLCKKPSRACDDGDAACFGIYCCWFGVPCHFGYYYPVTPVYSGGCYGCYGCGAGGASCANCNAGGGEGMAILLLIVVIILVIIGLIFAAIILTYFIFVIGRRHANILYKRELTKEEIVCDLSLYQYSTLDSLPHNLPSSDGSPIEI